MAATIQLVGCESRVRKVEESLEQVTAERAAGRRGKWLVADAERLAYRHCKCLLKIERSSDPAGEWLG